MVVPVVLPGLRPEREDHGQQRSAMAPFPGGPRWGCWACTREVGNTLPLSPGEECARPRARSKCSAPASSEPARRACWRTRWRASARPTSCSCETTQWEGAGSRAPRGAPGQAGVLGPPGRAPPGGPGETQPHADLPRRVTRTAPQCPGGQAGRHVCAHSTGPSPLPSPVRHLHPPVSTGYFQGSLRGPVPSVLMFPVVVLG